MRHEWKKIFRGERTFKKDIYTYIYEVLVICRPSAKIKS